MQVSCPYIGHGEAQTLDVLGFRDDRKPEMNDNLDKDD